MAGFKYGMVCCQCGADGLSEVRVEQATGRDWCIPCVEKTQSLQYDITDLADWELSVEVELTKIALPSLEEDKPEVYDHPQLPWKKYL